MAEGEVTLPETTIAGAVPEAPAPAMPALQSMSAGLVAVTDANGEVSQVRSEDAQAAFAQGLRPATRGEVVAEQMGTFGQVAAGTWGVARGVTMGLSDVGFVEGSRLIGGDAEAEDTRRILNDAKAGYGTTDTVGEIAGSLAGMVLMPGGGASAAVRGESMLARGASRFMAAAPRAALEGAAIAAGHQASEDALGNHEATAEKYVASIAGGAIFGGLLGGGLHAVGGAVADKARTFYGRATLSGGEALAGQGAYRTAGTVAEDAAEKGGGSPFMSWLRDKLTTGAEGQAFKATGAKIRDIQKLGATAEAQAERSQRIGRRLLDDGIVTGAASQEVIASRLTAKVNQVGKELGVLRAGLDDAVERPNTRTIINRVKEEVLAPLERLPGTQSEVGEVQRYLQDFADKAGERPSFKTLHEFRRALDDKLNPRLWAKVPGSAPPAAVEMGSVRRIIEDEFESAGERASKELGGDFGAKYRLAKEAFSDLRTAEKIIVKEVARGGANRSISLTDTIAGGAGLVAGGGVGSIVAAAGNKLMRSYGNQAAADAMNRVSRMEMLQRAAGQVDDQITGGVRGFLSGAKTAPSATAPKVTAATVAAIRDATRDPAAMTERVTAMLGGKGLDEAAPKTAQYAATAAMRIGAYLRDKAPKAPAPTGVSFVPERQRPGSASEQARFAEAVEVANNPLSVVDDLRRGRVSREKVDALKNCYPQLYQQVRSEIASQAAELRPTLTQQQQVGLSVLFDVPVSAIMQPKNIRAFNASFAQAPGESQADKAGVQQPMQGGRGLNRKSSLASGFDRQEEPTR